MQHYVLQENRTKSLYLPQNQLSSDISFYAPHNSEISKQSLIMDVLKRAAVDKKLDFKAFRAPALYVQNMPIQVAHQVFIHLYKLCSSAQQLSLVTDYW